MITTVKLHEKTKHELDTFREYKNESYDEVIQKLVFIVQSMKTKPRLSRDAINAIERARKRLQSRQHLTEEQTRQRFGL